MIQPMKGVGMTRENSPRGNSTGWQVPCSIVFIGILERRQIKAESLHSTLLMELHYLSSRYVIVINWNLWGRSLNKLSPGMVAWLLPFSTGGCGVRR